MAFAPPPSQIFCSSLRTCDMRSARNRILASNRAEVGSILVVSTFSGADAFTVGDSLRSAMGRRSGLLTVYQPGVTAQSGELEFAAQSGCSGAFEPLRQPAAVLLQQKCAHAKAFAEDAMRFRVAAGTRDPLLSHSILRGGEPLLRQDFDEPGLEVQQKQRKGGGVVRDRFVTRGNDQFVYEAQLRRHFNLVHPRTQRQRHFQIRERSRGRVNAIGRWLKPPRNFSQVKSFEVVRIEASQAKAAPLRTPDAEEMRRHKIRTAIGIECESHQFRLLLQAESNEMLNRARLRVMSPDEALSRGGTKSREGFPIPWN